MTRPLALEDLDWHNDAINMIRAWAESDLPFSSDDLRRSMRPAPNPNDYGNVFQAARRLGFITSVGFKESNQPSRKHGVVRVWVKAKEEQ